MDNTIKEAVNKLKALIDTNGPFCLSTEPYQTYKELSDSKSIDEKTAGAIMLVLVRGVDIGIHDDLEVLSKTIQDECCFNKRMADRLAEIFIALYSKDNEEHWKTRELEGWKQFVKTDLSFDWTGFSVWQASNGYVDCHFKAEIILKPEKSVKVTEKLAEDLERNPFMTKEAITEYYMMKISKYLDSEFEEYCTCDDYYQPVVEDFEIDDRIQYWCRENGFKLVSCEGDGYDDEYEPSF